MDKVWLNHYPEEVPRQIDLGDFSSLQELFKQCCSKYSQECAYWNYGTEISYQKLEELSFKLAAVLSQDFNLSPGDRVGVMMPNTLSYPILMFAILRLGGVIVNINPLYTPRELKNQLNDSGVTCLVVLENFIKTVNKVIQETKVCQLIISQLGDFHPYPKRFMLNTVNQWKHKPHKVRFVEYSFLHQIIKKNDDSSTYQDVKSDLSDIAFLQYTGGTTGISKGAMLSHGNILSNMLQVFHWFSPQPIKRGEAIATALPLYHIFALTANFCLPIYTGQKNILITNPRDTKAMIKAFRKQPFSIITGVDTLYDNMLNNKDFTKINFDNLRYTIAGGMSIRDSVAKKWQALTGCVVLQAYGLTEASPAVSFNIVTEKEFQNNVGMPLPGTEISFRGSQEEALKPGEEGELWVRGPQVMQGYWGNEDESQSIKTNDGWLKTGDIAKLDKKGAISIVDRKKDMILISGFNVFPREIEEVILSYPEVYDTGVIGLQNENGQEEIIACVTCHEKAVSEEDIINHCKQHLVRYKIPRRVIFLDDFPKSTVGKILKKELREQIKKMLYVES